MQLYYCIAVFPRLYPNTTYMPNTDYTDNKVVFIIWTDNVNAICATTISSNLQLWYFIAIFPRLHPSNTYLPNTDYTDNRVVFIIWTDSVYAICATTIYSNLQLWYCIAVFPRLYPPNTYQPNTDYTDYTGYRVFLIICTDNVNGPFVAPYVPLPLTNTVQLPVNGPCKSRYLAKNVICSTVLSLNIQLYYCIAVFPRLYPNTTYIPNTDYTDYTDNRVVFIIWTDNVNAICATTISSNLQLWYCIAVLPGLYPPNTYLPNTDYADYTGYRVVFNHLYR